MSSASAFSACPATLSQESDRMRHSGSRYGGQTVAITGGARGIGLAIAQAFHAEGANVVLGDLDVELATAAATDLGDRAHAVHLDVTDRKSFADFLAATKERFGGMHILVNNAGIMYTGPLLDEEEAITDRTLDINVRAVITGCKLAARSFIADGVQGSIVNIASLAGLLKVPDLATYVASKHAVVGLSESLSREWESAGIQVLSIMPTVVNTELATGLEVPRWLRPLMAVEPEDIANGVLKGLRRRQVRRSVHAFLAPLLRAFDLLIPYRPRRALERSLSLDTLMSGKNPEARAAYHAKITQGLS
ncbi:SDR family oxidoreductase [Pseudonocardiaceae bacterium YIM PH 21723]|nr:SDR family oxidoreductase [Pseudonocardiaceae bacterium YIM PH 21723]